jgi:hypothetical protein
MSTNKHSKYRNTGLLFELLVRRITADALEGSKSPAMYLLKKYYSNTELGKEYRLYEQLHKFKNLTEAKAEVVMNTLLEQGYKLKREEIRKQRYNLVREIKNHYDLEMFFRTRVNNYKVLAAFNNLLENKNTDVKLVINNRLTLLEYLTDSATDKETDLVLEEFKAQDRDVRTLAYRILLNKFNEKYDHLLPSQKEVLREVITSVENTGHLKQFYNQKITGVKQDLQKHMQKTTDPVVKIKLQEVTKYIKPLEKTEVLTNDNIINLLQYYELLNQL